MRNHSTTNANEVCCKALSRNTRCRWRGLRSWRRVVPLTSLYLYLYLYRYLYLYLYLSLSLYISPSPLFLSLYISFSIYSTNTACT